jgi:hypothetical protein
VLETPAFKDFTPARSHRRVGDDTSNGQWRAKATIEKDHS